MTLAALGAGYIIVRMDATVLHLGRGRGRKRTMLSVTVIAHSVEKQISFEFLHNC